MKIILGILALCGIFPLIVYVLVQRKRFEWVRIISKAHRCSEKGQHQEAIALAEEALENAKLRLGPEHPHIVLVLGDIGSYHEQLEQYDRAEECYLLALEIAEKNSDRKQFVIFQAMEYLKNFYEEREQFEKEEPLLFRELALYEKTYGENSPEVVFLYLQLAFRYRRHDDFEKEERHLSQAELILESSPEKERSESVHNMIILAGTYQEKGKHAEAEKWFKQAIAVSEKAFGPNHLQTARTISGLGNMYYWREQYVQAEPLFVRSLKIIEKAKGKNHHEVAENCTFLARLYHSQRRQSQAEFFYTRAIAIWEKMPNFEGKGFSEYHYAYCLNNLAELYLSQGRYTNVEPLLTKALATLGKSENTGCSFTAIVLGNIGVSHFCQNHYMLAESSFQRALAIIEEHYEPESSQYGPFLNNLTVLYRKMGRDDAIKVHGKSIAGKIFVPEKSGNETGISVNSLLYSLKLNTGWRMALLREAATGKA